MDRTNSVPSPLTFLRSSLCGTVMVRRPASTVSYVTSSGTAERSSSSTRSRSLTASSRAHWFSALSIAFARARWTRMPERPPTLRLGALLPRPLGGVNAWVVT